MSGGRSGDDRTGLVGGHGPGDRPTLETLLPSVAVAVGATGFADRLALPPAPRYVVLLIDGLGWGLLREHADAAPFLASLPGRDDLCSTVPSTTATSLTSLGTGLRPGAHGMVGYTVRVPGTSQRLNTLQWDVDVDPGRWQPHRTVLERLADAGVDAAVVNDRKFTDSGLTRCSQRGVPFHGIDSAWERLDVVTETIENAERVVVYAYESRLDHTGHGRGCASAAWRDMLRTVDAEAAALRDALPADTMLLVTADHGMLDVPGGSARFDVDQHPGLREDLVMLAGEGRFRHLHVRSGREDVVRARWAEVLGDRALVVLREESEPWLGPITTDNRGRVGDVVVAALGETVMLSSTDFPREFGMVGFHGSVTETELRVPLLLAG